MSPDRRSTSVWDVGCIINLDIRVFSVPFFSSSAKENRPSFSVAAMLSVLHSDLTATNSLGVVIGWGSRQRLDQITLRALTFLASVLSAGSKDAVKHASKPQLKRAFQDWRFLYTNVGALGIA